MAMGRPAIILKTPDIAGGVGIDPLGTQAKR